MSLFDRIKPRWQNSDARVRREAVAGLTNQAQLRQLAETDPDGEVRAAAYGRIKDGPELLALAKGGSEWSEKAVAGLAAAAHLIDVARHAANARARAAAVSRIEDPAVLLAIASLDEDPFVRRCARRHQPRSDGLRARLKDALAKLRIAEGMAGEVAEFCGSLDDVCSSIVADGRFTVHGLPAESAATGEEHRSPAGSTSVCFEGALAPRHQLVELLAGQSDRAAGPERGLKPVHYRIKVWRAGENAFAWNLEERHVALSKDAETWSRSSNGANTTAPGRCEPTTPTVQ
jgi:hypothetical protein